MSALRSVLIALIVSLLLVALAAGLWALRIPNPLDALDNYALDRWMLERNQKAPVPGFLADYSKRVVLVNVDDESLRRLGRWPWPRARFARLLEVMHAAGARVVAFDILFNQPADDDRVLSRTLALRPPLPVLATLYRVTSSDDVEVDRPLDWLSPPPQVKIAAVGVTPDRDGVLRHAPLAVPLPDGPALPSLPLAAWCAAQGISDVKVTRTEIRAGEVSIPARAGRVRIDWAVPDLHAFQVEQGFRELFPLCEVVPFADALTLDASLAREVFGGRIVLVGAMAQALKEDVKSTPLGDMPGLAIHASLLISLLEGRFLSEWPHQVQLGALVVSALVLGLAMGLRFNPLVSLLLTVALYAAWWFTARWLFFSHSVVVGLAAPALNGAVFTALLAWQTLLETREKAYVRRIFGQYLSPTVVDGLVAARREGRLGLAGKREKVTVLFADIRGFTAVAEAMTPEDVVGMLNEYFADMAEIVVRHGGYIDKYGGDSIMAVYSAPFPRPDDAIRAVRAAADMQARANEINARWEVQGRPRLEMGIGIDTGEVVLGNIGSPLKREYTVIGDHVNIAARLCGAAGRGQVLISADTWNEIHGSADAQPLPPLQVKGKSQPLVVYDLTSGTLVRSGRMHR